MRGIVLDASALLSFLGDEAGSSEVEEALTSGTASCSAVNWSEVLQKVAASGADADIAEALLEGYGLRVLDATMADARTAAASWKRGSGLSLADRFCLALAGRLDAVALTTDSAWGSSDRVRQLR